MYFFKRKGIWYFAYENESGKIKRVSTGEIDKIEAEKFAEAFLNAMPGVKQDRKESSIILSEYRDEYIQYISLSSSVRYVNDAIKPAFNKLIEFAGDISIDHVDVKILEIFLRSKFSKSKYSAYLYYRVLRAAFNVALKWNYIKKNPLPGIKLPKIPKPFPLFINSDELELILNNIKDPLLKSIYRFAFHTGMRLGELLNLKWNAVNIRERKIIVKIDSDFIPKGKKERIIPINKDVFNVLKLHLPKVISINSNEYVFTDKKGLQLKTDFVSKNFKRAVRNTPEVNSKVHMHTLRHSFASNLIQLGASLYEVKELLGHEDIKTTSAYSHLQFDNLMEAVKLLETNN